MLKISATQTCCLQNFDSSKKLKYTSRTLKDHAKNIELLLEGNSQTYFNFSISDAVFITSAVPA